MSMSETLEIKKEKNSKKKRSTPALVYTDVDFAYEKTLPLVLNDITLTIERKSITAIIGASGSGKSTILSLAAGLITPTNGTVTLPLRTRMIFQNGALLPWQTAYENVWFGLLSTSLSDTTKSRRTHAALSSLGVLHVQDHYPRDVSGGERQRIGIARAIISEPELLLLDEPFSALDVDTTLHLTNLLEDICMKKHMTMLMVSHSVENAVQLADRILVCKNGTLVQDMTVPFARPRKTMTPEMLVFAKNITL